jgi:arylsulfatase A-like enzyme
MHGPADGLGPARDETQRGRALGAALAALALALIGAGLWLALRPRAPRRPNVVLITIESLRTDHVGCYGGARPTTPELDALAQEGVVYERAHAVTSWTLASHASLFTGLYPSAHRAERPLSRLDEKHRTLAEILAAAGYQCGGVVSGPYLRRPHGLHQGFAFWDERPSSLDMAQSHDDVTNPEMLAGVERFLERLDPDRPFFLFAYFWDPHFDYLPPAPYDRQFVGADDEPVDVRDYEAEEPVRADIRPAQLDYVRAQYDGEIRWTDEHLGRLLASLRARGLWDDTLIAVTADHGEEFFEHGHKGHKHNVYQESVHVPLVVKYPGAGPRGRDGRLASLVDVLPTVLEVTSVADPLARAGRSLLAQASERPVFLELLETWYIHRPGEPETREELAWFAVLSGQQKLLFVPREQRLELYDLASDPRETRDLAAQRPETVRDLMQSLEAWRAEQLERARAYSEDARAELGDEDLARLRALGYVR